MSKKRIPLSLASLLAPSAVSDRAAAALFGTARATAALAAPATIALDEAPASWLVAVPDPPLEAYLVELDDDGIEAA